jgi:hypothetical protein
MKFYLIYLEINIKSSIIYIVWGFYYEEGVGWGAYIRVR